MLQSLKGGYCVTEAFPTSDMPMTVTWGDSDPAGISYYARTFDWFTNGRLDFLRAYGMPYMETFHAQGIALVCLHADCDYKKMVRPGDKLTLETLLTNLTRTRITFTYRVFNEDGELTQEGVTRLAFTDTNAQPFNLKRRFPELWKQLTDVWQMQ